jgi:hypothetical protein
MRTLIGVRGYVLAVAALTVLELGFTYLAMDLDYSLGRAQLISQVVVYLLLVLEYSQGRGQLRSQIVVLSLEAVDWQTMIDLRVDVLSMERIDVLPVRRLSPSRVTESSIWRSWIMYSLEGWNEAACCDSLLRLYSVLEPCRIEKPLS